MNIVPTPELQINRDLYPDGHIPPNRVLEQRIVINLLAHLEAVGFPVTSIWDEDNGRHEPMKSAIEAMELIFNLDESKVFFTSAAGKRHWVFLVCGNGIDIISDYGYPIVSDGFEEAMADFDPEQFE